MSNETPTPLVTPGAIADALTRENEHLRMRERIAKEANDAMRAELADARAELARLREGAKEMEIERDCLRVDRDALSHQRNQADARLRAVTEAADDMRWVLDFVTEKLRLENYQGAQVLLHLNGRGALAIARYDAARSGDLPTSAPKIDTSAQRVDAVDTSADLPPRPKHDWQVCPECKRRYLGAHTCERTPHPDTERLDWMEKHTGAVIHIDHGDYEHSWSEGGARVAIDAARRAEKEAGA